MTASESMSVRDRVRRFILDNHYFGDGPLADDTSLIGLGIVDSTGVLDIVGFLEEVLGVEVDDDEIVPDNLDSVAAIAAFVERKRALGRAAS